MWAVKLQDQFETNDLLFLGFLDCTRAYYLEQADLVDISDRCGLELACQTIDIIYMDDIGVIVQVGLNQIVAVKIMIERGDISFSS
jgi:hypothetical protein